MTWYDIVIPIATALLGFLSTLFIERMKQKKKIPKIKVYSSVLKNERQSRYFNFYYSKFFHSSFFIARLNIENLSETPGLIHNVTLSQKDTFYGPFLTYPLSKENYKKDPILIDYLSSEKFSNDIFFNKEVVIPPYSTKTVCFVFDVFNQVKSIDANIFSLSYCCSGLKHVVKNIKLTITDYIFTDHYSSKENREDFTNYYNEHPEERHQKFKSVHPTR